MQSRLAMSTADLWDRLRKSESHRLRSRPVRYGIAVFAVAAAAVLQFIVQGLGFFHVPYLFFLPAVLLIALLAGFWPGVTATSLSAVAGAYFLFSAGPHFTAAVRAPVDFAKPPLFFVIALFFTALASGRYRAQLALHVSESELNRAQAVAHIGSWHYDSTRGTLRLSTEAHRILGLPLDANLSLEQGRRIVLAEDLDRADRAWADYGSKDALAGGAYDQELRISVKGQTRWVRIQASLERRSEGRSVGAVGTVQDITEVKLAQDRLREFERAVEGVDEMISVVDRDYRWLIANDAFLKHRRTKKEEVVGKLISELVDPQIFESAVKPRLDQCFEGKIVQYEIRYKYPVLGERDLFVTYYPIEGPNGVERVASVIKDLTEGNQAELSLILFRTLIDQSNDAVEVLDPETLRFLDVNERACKDLGYTRAELLAMTVFDINPGVDEANRTQVAEKLRTDGFVLQQGLHRRKDGTTFPVETSLRLVQLDRSYVVAISRDISKRKTAEAALQASEDRYRDLVDHSEDLLCTHDLQGRLLTVNPAPARILGYEVDELLKIPMRDLIVPEGREIFDAYLERLRTTGAPEKGLLCVTTKSGEVRAWEYSNTLRTEGVDKPIVRGMAHDITERRRAELALQQSEERFTVALKNSPITVFNQDCDLRYTWIYNASLCWQNDVIGKSDEELMGSKKAARLKELKRRVLDSRAGLREEVVIPHNGKTYAFDLTIEPLFDTNRKVIGITGALMDIARLHELADSLRDAKERLVQEKSYLESEIQAELGFEEVIGQSPALREVLKKARVVAPIDSTVLLLGESGTGKELVARAVHALSSRHERNFIKLNCAAVPSGLLESELFGHERGAFTGALNQKIGRVELADKGTLFLDEIGELPLELQPKLLRLVQDREFERLGGTNTLRVDVRIIAATNRDLQKDVAVRKFREDLFYRLNVFPIQLPPLRERRVDIPSLVHHFVRKHAARMGKHIEIIPAETVTALQNQSWPGNVRELENMIERMVILTKGHVLAAPPEGPDAPQEIADDDLTEMERQHITRVLRETNGVLAGPEGAATRLGIKRTTLQSMLKRFNIDLEEFRQANETFEAE
jgi:formate hydrogenlyase transcriptional activator